MAQLGDTEYTEEDEQSDDDEEEEEEEQDKEGRTLTTGATSLSYMGASVGGASVGGASAVGVSIGRLGSRNKSDDGFSKPKASAKQ